MKTKASRCLCPARIAEETIPAKIGNLVCVVNMEFPAALPIN
jgi:hypothetical protein